jgi:hypothetical protein
VCRQASRNESLQLRHDVGRAVPIVTGVDTPVERHAGIARSLQRVLRRRFAQHREVDDVVYPEEGVLAAARHHLDGEAAQHVHVGGSRRHRTPRRVALERLWCSPRQWTDG